LFIILIQISSFLFHLFFFLLIPPPPTSPLFPYTTLFRSSDRLLARQPDVVVLVAERHARPGREREVPRARPHRHGAIGQAGHPRSEEHTSELQSQSNLVCRLLLEKKKAAKKTQI